jgi:hypothetical protein
MLSRSEGRCCNPASPLSGQVVYGAARQRCFVAPLGWSDPDDLLGVSLVVATIDDVIVTARDGCLLVHVVLGTTPRKSFFGRLSFRDGGLMDDGGEVLYRLLMVAGVASLSEVAGRTVRVRLAALSGLPVELVHATDDSTRWAI